MKYYYKPFSLLKPRDIFYLEDPRQNPGAIIHSVEFEKFPAATPVWQVIFESAAECEAWSQQIGADLAYYNDQLKKSTLITMRIPNRLLSQVDALATIDKRNRSSMIRSILNTYIHKRYEIEETKITS